MSSSDCIQMAPFCCHTRPLHAPLHSAALGHASAAAGAMRARAGKGEGVPACRRAPAHARLFAPGPVDVVFNARGEREQALAAAGRDMIDAFEALLSRLVEPAELAGVAGSRAGGHMEAADAAGPGARQQEEVEGRGRDGGATSPPLASMLQARPRRGVDGVPAVRIRQLSALRAPHSVAG